uniref:Uncharacterized protein n=1 Tax=viral metagenome TaxID=1070528 RepID=A0A6C0LDG1_9ZZZZ
MNRAITIRYISVLLVLLSAIVAVADCYINSFVSMSSQGSQGTQGSPISSNTRKKNIVKKGNTYHRKFANENEKYLYGNYLVTLRKFKRTINYNKIFNNMTEQTKEVAGAGGDSRDIKGIADDIYFNIKNNTIINNDQYIAKSISLANIKIDVSTVKYIQISTKNDTITIELDKNNDNSKNTDSGFINYDLGKIDSLISAISILMNLLNIH